MAETTDFLRLTLPAGSDRVDIEAINKNFELLEIQAKTTENTVKANHTACTAHAAPMQDASVEGRYLLFAEYTFPQKANYESSDLTLLIRNHGMNTAAEDGILRVRLCYDKAAAAFQYAQSYFMQCIGLDAAKFLLCCNNAAGKAQLWLDASTAYAGYICKVLDMGTSANVVDFSAWKLYSSTTGQAEFPTEADGWTTVTSADAATAAEVT